MRIIVLAAMQFIFWSAYYALTAALKDERMVLGAFVFTLVISMVTASIFLARQK